MTAVHEMAHEIDRLRGNVISNFAFIESVLNDILTAEYASEDKKQQDLFKHEMLEHKYFSFDFKKTLLQQIIKRKYTSEWKRFPRKDLEDMQTYRNIIAHALLEYYPKGDSKGVEEDCFQFKYQGNSYEAHKLIQEYRTKSNRVQPVVEEHFTRVTGRRYHRS